MKEVTDQEQSERAFRESEFYRGEWYGMDFHNRTQARQFANMIRMRQQRAWDRGESYYDVRQWGTIIALRDPDGGKPWAVWEQIRSTVKPLGDGMEPDFELY